MVVDWGNSRVLRFDGAASKANGSNADGVLGQADFTSNAQVATASGMNLPYDLAVDSAGHLWVADSGNNRVLRFDGAAGKANGANADGVLGQANFTSSGNATTASTMRSPFGVTVDSAGRLWVADTFNNRVLRFAPAAALAIGAAAAGVIGQPNFTSNTQATTTSGINLPYDMTIDSADNLWIADLGNNRVLRFDRAAGKANGTNADVVLGQPDFTSNNHATTASGLYTPEDVSVDSADNVWIADWDNNRVLRFDGPQAPMLPRVYLPPIAR